MKRASAYVAAVTAALTVGLGIACTSGELVVGDDSDASTNPIPGQGPPPTSTSTSTGTFPTTVDAGLPDADPDAKPDKPVTSPPVPCEVLSGTCVDDGAACFKAAPDGGAKCPSNQFCCVTPCPALTPPAPTFCDGGPIAATYSAGGCTVGYLCAPAGCAAAGGTCLDVAKASCPGGVWGDAAKYSCVGGAGVGCCLP